MKYFAKKRGFNCSRSASTSWTLKQTNDHYTRVYNLGRQRRIASKNTKFLGNLWSLGGRHPFHRFPVSDLIFLPFGLFTKDWSETNSTVLNLEANGVWFGRRRSRVFLTHDQQRNEPGKMEIKNDEICSPWKKKLAFLVNGRKVWSSKGDIFLYFQVWHLWVSITQCFLCFKLRTSPKNQNSRKILSACDHYIVEKLHK